MSKTIHLTMSILPVHCKECGDNSKIQMKFGEWDMSICCENCGKEVDAVGRNIDFLTSKWNNINTSKEYEIWSSGFDCDGGWNEHQLMGKEIGVNFMDACATYFKDNKFYNPDNNTYYAVELFDNETDAINCRKNPYKK